jgi:DNA-binding winged helix-turn-helix (wHTH) protein
MMPEKPLFYEFGGLILDVARRRLLRHGEALPLAPKPFDTLLLLVENRGRVLEKDELMKNLWPESFVEEGNLSQNIFVLRRLLADGNSGKVFIQTIPGRGYKFVAAVKEIACQESTIEASAVSSPTTAQLSEACARAAFGDVWWSWTGAHSTPSKSTGRSGANTANKTT